MLTKTQIAKIQKAGGSEGSLYPKLFNALGDPTRWQIFSLLVEYDDLCVTDLARVLNISVPAASQQLRILELSGLVTPQRKGQSICYHVQEANPATKSIIRLLQSIDS